MGRRSRRRNREAASKTAAEKGPGRSLPDGQRMARVNIEASLWEQFLLASAAADRSVADYLVHLVRKELRRVARREWRAEALVPTLIEKPQVVTVGADTQDEVM